MDEGDTSRDIADVIDHMTWAAYRANLGLGSGQSPDGFILFTTDFRDREVFITGGMFTIDQDYLPCEVQLWVDDALSEMASFDIRIGDTPDSKRRIMKQLTRGSIRWLVEYSGTLD